MPSMGLDISLSFLNAVVAVLTILSAVIWWIVRKKRNRVWLPTLRLIKDESSPLPKIKMKKPPILLFLCFLGSAVTMIFLSLEPSQKQYRDIGSNVSKIHLYLDLSPSTENLKIDENWDQFLNEVFLNYTKQGSVSASSSASKVAVKFQSSEEFIQWSQKQKIHNAGLKLGNSVHQQLESIGSIDKLVIISDQDKYSWSDFNWRYLETKMEVIRAAPSDRLETRNIFIDGAELKSNETGSQVVWNAKIYRNYKSGLINGNLKASFEGRELAQTTWQIHEGQKFVNVEIQWPWSKWGDIIGGGDEIVWSIKTEAPNYILADDQFRTLPHGLQKDILIISEPKGEMFLEDPIHHLKIALDVLGFRVKRLDINADKKEFWNLPLWAVAGGQGPLVDFCPLQYEKRRLEVGKNLESRSSLPIVWLFPKDFAASYRNLCWCYSHLIESSKIDNKLPLYCEDVETRDQYISVLKSLGAKQIGGNVGDAIGSMAWHRKDESGAEVFAFTLPLTPSKMTGVSYDVLPALIKTFLRLSYLIGEQGENKKSGWPRTADISKSESEKRISNVPRGESIYIEENSDFLPPFWKRGASVSVKSSPGVREESDPRMWIELVFWLLVTLGLIEGSWLLTQFFRGHLAKITIIFLMFPLFSSKTEASVNLNLIGHNFDQTKGDTLARDVAARTSIALNRELNIFHSLNEVVLREPWFWVKNRNILESASVSLETVKRYIKRGGFIVIENERNLEKLDEIFDLQGGEWKAIPPDHEIMRSFHLLDSLPKCKDRVWLGYHFDDRIASIAIPYGFLNSLLDVSNQDSCASKVTRERATRIFINILMVALATDYKKDQIHLPEILKRLR